jgi:predicted dehydrogenase
MPREAVVVLGCGWIARRHAAAARRIGLQVAFASRDPLRARAYAREFGGIAAYGSYAEGLRDPAIAGAIVCTPHDRHLADVLAALEQGKHVLVEKPIARTLHEADRMIGAAREAGRALMVAENFHFMPAFRHVKTVLAGDTIGGLRELHLVSRGFREPRGWRGDSEVTGGGALIDGGIHYVHNLRWWGGTVRRVFALRTPQTLGGMTAEDAVNLLAELPDGLVGFLSNSLAAPGLPRFQWSTVTGTEGTCFADNRGRVVAVRGRGGWKLRLFVRDTRGHAAMLAGFREAMKTGRAAEMDGASGRADLAIVLAAYRSIAERAPVEVPC